MKINDYILKQNESFEEKNVNEVDAAILSQILMFGFEFIGKKHFFIKELSLIIENKEIFNVTLSKNSHYEFFLTLIESNRYKNLSISNFVSIKDTETETQFAAGVINLTENLSFIAFRGTDASLLGWKEDFNMVFESKVNAQQLALEYLDSILSENNKKQFIVGGHSKGGNLTEYACINSKFKDKIKAIYNNDGPGFKNNIYETEEYYEIQSKIIKLIPSASPIGSLMYTDDDRTFYIKSYAKGLLQHDILTWNIDFEQDMFKRELGLHMSSMVFNEFLLNMIEKTNDEERKFVVDTLFSPVDEEIFEDLTAIKDKWFSQFSNLFFAGLENAKKDNRTKIFHMLKLAAPEFIKTRRHFAIKGKCIYCNKKVHAFFTSTKTYYRCYHCQKTYLEISEDKKMYEN